MSQFSVIIPTLQRSPMLRPLVDAYVDHPSVGEVLVINNAPEPLHWESAKVRVLQQPENIYVNPAWNLGAAEASCDNLIFSNDDIVIEPRILDTVASKLGPEIGIITGCARCVNRRRPHFLYFTPAFRRFFGMGIWFAMEKSAYSPIPAELLIYCGDDWLFDAQSDKRNLLLHGARFETEMSTTSGDPAFSPIKEKDVAAFHALRMSAGDEGPRTLSERAWSLMEKVHNEPQKILPWKRRSRQDGAR